MNNRRKAETVLLKHQIMSSDTVRMEFGIQKRSGGFAIGDDVLPSDVLIVTIGLISSRPSFPSEFTARAAHWTREPA